VGEIIPEWWATSSGISTLAQNNKSLAGNNKTRADCLC